MLILVYVRLRRLVDEGRKLFCSFRAKINVGRVVKGMSVMWIFMYEYLCVYAFLFFFYIVFILVGY